MKKLISLLLAVLMLALLIGCGADETQNDIDNNTPKVEISRGKIEGAVYKNDYLGIEFTSPKSWVYSTDEEVAAIVNIDADDISVKNFKASVETYPSVYDMMVVDSVTRTNINVGYENLSKTLSSNITIEQYVESVKEQFKSVPNMEVTFPDKLDKVKLGDTEFTRVICNTTMNGSSMTQVYYLRKSDIYMSFVIVTITDGYSIADIEAMFK